MNSITSGWATYHEGQKFGWGFHVSDEDMQAFMRLSNDHNPIHTDSEFAQRKGFKAPIVFGMLLSSQVSRLIGEELADKHSMLTGMSMDFVSPAFVSDELKFFAELIMKSEATHALDFKCKITRDGKTLCRGSASAVWRP